MIVKNRKMLNGMEVTTEVCTIREPGRDVVRLSVIIMKEGEVKTIVIKTLPLKTKISLVVDALKALQEEALREVEE